MITTIGINGARVTHVRVTGETLTVDLADGRTVTAPLTWFPRLVHATTKERANWRLVGAGRGVRWADLDEDIPVSNLLVGQPSSESESSVQKWLETREKYRRAKQRVDK